MKAEISNTVPQTAGAPPALAVSDDEGDGTSLGREILSGLLGMGIAVACVLPPLVHLITGPLGPFIGGFVAANRARPGARGRMIIAAIIGTGLAGIIALVARIFVGLVGRSELPRWFPSAGTLMAIIGAAWVYGMAMATAGTAASNALARRKDRE
jgi:protein-S-isoprenylcysteine O-methyltransferase Ste14